LEQEYSDLSDMFMVNPLNAENSRQKSIEKLKASTFCSFKAKNSYKISIQDLAHKVPKAFLNLQLRVGAK
jgi:hypothetical protein